MRGLRGSRGLNQSAYRLHARLVKIKTAEWDYFSYLLPRPSACSLPCASLARPGGPRATGAHATRPCEEAEQSHQDVLDQGPEEI